MAIVIEKFSADRLDECVAVLANAFVDNPLHRSAFGRGRIDQNRLFFRIGLRHMFVGAAFVALVDGAVSGYVQFNASPHCLPAPPQLATAVSQRVNQWGEAVLQVIRWFTRWCHLYPEAPHVHLGPIGDTPAMQGQGVGTALMNRYVDYLKQAKSAGYLETDRPENVEFYKKFGFVVQGEEMLIGTSTWDMWRPRDEHLQGG